ncbi:hypothetical protein [Acinetobacter sp. AOR43_HL]|uniref:hypothetical protein n=1 Tax=Acinetobacter sp. AOR43_HL TaxID=2919390 RepID=UPI0022EA158A|nr:hypothetical protein [Acinetobacter sp. AOR43_HL]
MIDDTLSTGGAVIALAEALKTAGSTIEKVICAIEKVQNKGKEKVKEITGLDVTSIMKIEVFPEEVKVVK